MIKFRCHNCQQKIGVQDDYGGRQVWCPNCTAATTVPNQKHNAPDMHNPNENTQYSIFICHGMAADD